LHIVKVYIYLLSAIFSVLIIPENPAYAVRFNTGTSIGLMTQPTSSYFHGVYGAFIDVSNETEKLILRASYVERPKFVSGGYIDQEYGFFGQVGTRFGKNKSSGLKCLVGYGRMKGYLAVDRKTNPEGNGSLKTYSLPGPSITLEYVYSWKNFETSISNVSFTGLGDKTQLDAKVAWPYSFSMINFAYRY